MQKITGMLFYLNENLGRETGFEEKRRRYGQMLWSHRDVLLKDYLYQTRSNAQPIWIWESQTSYGSAIKYRKVSGTVVLWGRLISIGLSFIWGFRLSFNSE